VADLAHRARRAVTEVNSKKLAGCTGKPAFASAVTAHRAAQRFSKPNRRRERRPVNVYHCQYCGHWHIGRRPQ
jgi:hypothetical protein